MKPQSSGRKSFVKREGGAESGVYEKKHQHPRDFRVKETVKGAKDAPPQDILAKESARLNEGKESARLKEGAPKIQNAAGPSQQGQLEVILDTNMLMAVFQFRFALDQQLKNVLGAHEVVIPSSVMRELRRLSKRIPEARMAERLAERFRVVGTNEFGDDSILAIAKRRSESGNRVIVATNDAELIRRLEEAGLHVIFLRGRTHLELR